MNTANVDSFDDAYVGVCVSHYVTVDAAPHHLFPLIVVVIPQVNVLSPVALQDAVLAVTRRVRMEMRTRTDTPPEVLCVQERIQKVTDQSSPEQPCVFKEGKTEDFSCRVTSTAET